MTTTELRKTGQHRRAGVPFNPALMYIYSALALLAVAAYLVYGQWAYLAVAGSWVLAAAFAPLTHWAVREVMTRKWRRVIR